MDTTRQPTFDTGGMTTLSLLHKELTNGLAEAGNLNMTQYRVLLKTHEITDTARLGDIATALHIAANVATQAADALESQDLVTRVRSGKDGRATLLCITHDGIRRIQEIDAALSRRIADLWAESVPREDNPSYQEAIQAIGIGIEGAPLQPQDTSITSAYITTVEEGFRGASDTVKSVAGATFNECRILQRLHDVGGRSRIVDLSEALMLASNTTTHAADRLVGRGWARRSEDPADRKAVYLEITEDGLNAMATMRSALDAYGHRELWSQLTEEQAAMTYDAASLLWSALTKRHSDRIVRRKASLRGTTSSFE